MGTNYVTCTATDKSRNLAESSFSVIIKATKGKISNTETGISRILQNITNQHQPSEYIVSDNNTSIPQPASTVIEKIPSPPNLSDDILNMFKILIEDLK